MKSILTKNQKTTFTKTGVMVDGQKVDINATVRYDDECGNGHNSFSITGDMWEAGKPHTDRYNLGGGCIHEAIEQAFPELAPFIKWHLVSSDEPMYYLANTMYHARNTDYDGLKKGEHSAYIINVIADINKDGSNSVIYSSGSVYTNKQNNPNLEKSNLKELEKVDNIINNTLPEVNPRTEKTPCKWSISDGKEIDLKAARNCAIWPNATLEQLQDEQVLKDRLPALMAEFKADVTSDIFGFTY